MLTNWVNQSETSFLAGNSLKIFALRLCPQKTVTLTSFAHNNFFLLFYLFWIMHPTIVPCWAHYRKEIKWLLTVMMWLLINPVSSVCKPILLLAGGWGAQYCFLLRFLIAFCPLWFFWTIPKAILAPPFGLPFAADVSEGFSETGKI